MCLKQNQPYKVCQKSKGPVIKASRPLILQEKRRFQVVSQAYSLSPLSNLSPKHIQTPPNTFDSSLFTTITRQHSCTQSSSPWFHTLDLRFMGMDVAFQLQSTPLLYIQLFLAFSCSIISNFSPKHIQTTPNTFDSSLFTTITRQCSCTQSFSPWFHTLDLWFWGVDVAFQLQSTHFFYLQLFLAFSCSIICFIAFPSMFLLYSMFYVFSSMFPCFRHDLLL